jgi:hypothetical protein
VGNIWSHQSKILAKDGAASDYFGHSVTVFDTTGMIGAPGDDDKATDLGMNEDECDRSVNSIIYNIIYNRFSLYIL